MTTLEQEFSSLAARTRGVRSPDAAIRDIIELGAEMSTIRKEGSAGALARIRDLLEQERISEARSALHDALAAQPDDEDLLRLQVLLAPPQVRKSDALDTDRTQDFQWLSENAAEHPGRWVAIHEGKLVAEAASLNELLEQVSALPLTHSPLIHFID